MEHSPQPQKPLVVVEVLVGTRPYHFCRKCNRFGQVGWTHLCGVNWYPTVEELDEATSTEPPYGVRVG